MNKAGTFTKVPKVFVFLEGNFSWWCAYKIPQFCRLRFLDIISDFLKKLETAKQISLTTTDISIVYTSSENNQEHAVENLNSPLPDLTSPNSGSIDIIVTYLGLDTIQRSIRSNTPQSARFVSIGKHFVEIGDTTNAVPFFRAAGLSGDLELAKLYDSVGAIDRLSRLLPRLFQYFPGNIDVLLMHCRVLEKHGKYREALERYVRMSQCSDRIEIFVRASRCFLTLNDFSRSSFKIRQALSIDDCNKDAIKQLCRLKIDSGDLRSAVVIALRHPKAYKFLAEISASDNGQEEIRNVIFNSRTIDSSMVFTLPSVVKVAKVCFKKGKVDFAKNILEQIESIDFCIEAEYNLLKIAFCEHDKVRFCEIIKKFSMIPNMDRLFPYFSISDILSFVTAHVPVHPKYPKLPELSDFPEGSLPYVKVWMLCVAFLFTHGKYTAALELKDRFPQYLKLVNQSSKFGSLKTMFQLADIKQSIQTQGKKRIAFVGDEYSIIVCPLSITDFSSGVNDGVYSVEHFVLPGLSLYSFFAKHTGVKKIFERLLERLLSYEAVVFCFGNLDCLYDIPKSLRRLEYDTPLQTVSVITKYYSEFINEFSAKTKGSVFVHPAIPLTTDTARIVGLFNSKLYEDLKNKNIFINVLNDEKCFVPKTMDLNHGTHIGSYRFHLRTEIESKLAIEGSVRP